MKSPLLNICVALAAGAMMTGCMGDEPNTEDVYTYNFLETFQSVTAFTGDGYWKFCYDPRYSEQLTFGNLINFSHSTSSTTYEGVTYSSWKGFCPSKSTDRGDYTDKGNWVDHQWASIAAPGMFGQNYMIACADASETLADAATSNTVVIKPKQGKIEPSFTMITNTSYGYWAMKNGTEFNRAFGPDDWCTLNITAVTDNKAGNTVKVELAGKTGILNNWLQVDLRSLGKCDKVVFTMESSDSGQWGMNNPAYFALDCFAWK